MGVTETKYHRIGNEVLVHLASEGDGEASQELVSRGTRPEEVDELISQQSRRTRRSVGRPVTED